VLGADPARSTVALNFAPCGSRPVCGQPPSRAAMLLSPARLGAIERRAPRGGWPGAVAAEGGGAAARPGPLRHSGWAGLSPTGWSATGLSAARGRGVVGATPTQRPSRRAGGTPPRCPLGDASRTGSTAPTSMARARRCCGRSASRGEAAAFAARVRRKSADLAARGRDAPDLACRGRGKRPIADRARGLHVSIVPTGAGCPVMSRHPTRLRALPAVGVRTGQRDIRSSRRAQAALFGGEAVPGRGEGAASGPPPPRASPIERLIGRAIFGNCWLLAPFYLGLVLGLVTLLRPVDLEKRDLDAPAQDSGAYRGPDTGERGGAWSRRKNQLAKSVIEAGRRVSRPSTPAAWRCRHHMPGGGRKRWPAGLPNGSQGEAGCDTALPMN
jgi:hypothetical protein